MRIQPLIPFKVAASCPSGGVVRNDVLLHYATNSMPFGGLGTSGYGSAHGKFGFDAFTHKVGHAVKDKGFLLYDWGWGLGRYWILASDVGYPGVGSATMFMLYCWMFTKGMVLGDIHDPDPD